MIGKSLVCIKEMWYGDGFVQAIPVGKIFNIVRELEGFEGLVTIIEDPTTLLMMKINNMDYDESESTVKYFKKI